MEKYGEIWRNMKTMPLLIPSNSSTKNQIKMHNVFVYIIIIFAQWNIANSFW